MSNDEMDGLARRFAESETALVEARSRIEKLARAEENAAASADALNGAAEALQLYADQAGEAVAGMALVQQEARRVLEEGVKLLDGNELQELRTSIDGLSAKVDERLSQIESRVADVEAVGAERDALRHELEHIKANVADRHLRKAMESLRT